MSDNSLDGALALYQAGRIAEAGEAFHQVAAARPADPWAHYYLGVITYNAKDFNAAERHLRTAAEHAGRDFRCLDQATQVLDRVLGNRMVDQMLLRARLLEADPGSAIHWQAIEHQARTARHMIATPTLPPDFRSNLWSRLLIMHARASFYRARRLAAVDPGSIGPAPRCHDCTLFFNELDMLELRLNILDEVVDHFVIVEASYTFTGKPKELVFPRHRDRFARFLDKITYLSWDGPLGETAFDTSDLQRNMILEGLRDAAPDDLVLMSDLDEIPRPEVVRSLRAKPPADVVCLQLPCHYYFLDVLFRPQQWNAAVAARWAFIRHAEPAVTREFRAVPGVTTIRDAGWHFTWMGGIDMIIEKIGASAHQEMDSARYRDPEEIRKAMADLKHIPGLEMLVKDQGSLEVVRPMDGYPAWIMDNLDHYRALGWLYPD